MCLFLWYVATHYCVVVFCLFFISGMSLHRSGTSCSYPFHHLVNKIFQVQSSSSHERTNVRAYAPTNALTINTSSTKASLEAFRILRRLLQKKPSDFRKKPSDLLKKPSHTHTHTHTHTHKRTNVRSSLMGICPPRPIKAGTPVLYIREHWA